MAPDGVPTWDSPWQLAPRPADRAPRTVAQPFMEDLYTALNQHVQLAVLEGREAVVVERLSEPGAIGLASQVGGRLPLHSSAVGKCCSRTGQPALFDAVEARGLTRFTPQNDHRSRAASRELADCRRTGTATVHEEMTPRPTRSRPGSWTPTDA